MSNEKNILKNRHEFVFLYDVSWANPNGDPLADNEPRQDKRRERILVSDDRIKRTVRDTLKELGYKIFVVGERGEDGELKTKAAKVKEIGSAAEVLERCIDVRLFGEVFALQKDKGKGKKSGEEEQEEGEEKSMPYVGPVQISWGESLHRASVEYIKGTTVMPSKEGKGRGTMLEEYKVPYALIGAYGVINERNAKLTGLTQEDVEAFFRALWIGHQAGSALLTTSKLGHMPRLLIDIVYKEGEMVRIGELTRYIKLSSDLPEKDIRDVSEFTLDLSALFSKLLKHQSKIEKVRYIMDDRLRLSPELNEVFKGFDTRELNLETDKSAGVAELKPGTESGSES